MERSLFANAAHGITSLVGRYGGLLLVEHYGWHVGGCYLVELCILVNSRLAIPSLASHPSAAPPSTPHTATGTAGGHAPFAVASGALQWRIRTANKLLVEHYGWHVGDCYLVELWILVNSRLAIPSLASHPSAAAHARCPD